ncbi:hypothetical protein [Pseudonocardia sp. KRD291]|uniref:hypothetical protein n=1 Tax=Pseudonocardia sp. KRD291 TaxID=2792007 RepID=UPI001C49F8F0|nr:hypothetical protein [Pseudonocardia sp. KRD291]MBW0106387.1 hypothetical protein [Pseudonocardia sp. KRD291]
MSTRIGADAHLVNTPAVGIVRRVWRNGHIRATEHRAAIKFGALDPAAPAERSSIRRIPFSGSEQDPAQGVREPDSPRYVVNQSGGGSAACIAMLGVAESILVDMQNS